MALTRSFCLGASAAAGAETRRRAGGSLTFRPRPRCSPSNVTGVDDAILKVMETAGDYTEGQVLDIVDPELFAIIFRTVPFEPVDPLAVDIENALYGAAGIPTFPTAAAAADGVSMAEVLRYIQENQLGKIDEAATWDWLVLSTPWLTGSMRSSGTYSYENGSGGGDAIRHTQSGSAGAGHRRL